MEIAESVDMLRFLEHGCNVRLVETDVQTRTVDTPTDLAMVEGLMRSEPMVSRYLTKVNRADLA